MIRSMDALLTDMRRRIVALERRRSRPGGGGFDSLPPGIMTEWGSLTPPSGWLICDGAEHPRALYPALFAAIGTTYGAGDGLTTFNVPDFRSRVPVGYDASQTEFDALGKAGGAKTHLLTAAQSGLPAHTHPVGGTGSAFVANGSGGGSANVSTGGGGYQLTAPQNATARNATEAHNNLQPYRVVAFIIKATQGATPGDSALALRVAEVERRTEDTGWIPATLIAPWTNVAGMPAAFRRMGGVVFLRGRVTGGTPGTPAFQLPVGFRPAQDTRLPSGDGASATYVTLFISSGGAVAPSNGSAPNLTGQFPADD